MTKFEIQTTTVVNSVRIKKRCGLKILRQKRNITVTLLLPSSPRVDLPDRTSHKNVADQNFQALP